MRQSPFFLLECYLMHKDGYRVRVEISGSPIIDEYGEFHGYRGIAHAYYRRMAK